MVFVGKYEPTVRASPVVYFSWGLYLAAIGSAGSVLAAVVTAVGNTPGIQQSRASNFLGGQQVVHYPATMQGVPPQQPAMMQYGAPPQAGYPAPPGNLAYVSGAPAANPAGSYSYGVPAKN